MTTAEKLSAALTERGLMVVHARRDCAYHSSDCVRLAIGDRWHTVSNARKIDIEDPATAGILWAMVWSTPGLHSEFPCSIERRPGGVFEFASGAPWLLDHMSIEHFGELAALVLLDHWGA